MTTLFMDGFDHYGQSGTGGTNQDILRSNMLAGGPYAFVADGIQIGVPPWGQAATGSYCLIGENTIATYTRRILPATKTHLFVSFRFAVDSFANFQNRIFGVLDGSGNTLYELCWTASAGLSIKNNAGTTLATTAGPVLTAQNWHFLEMEINTAGNWIVRVDDAQASGTPVLTAALSGGTIAQIGLLQSKTSINAGPTPYMDDLFVRDSSGSVNNSWLGDRRIGTLFANADTTDAGWTPNYYREISPGVGFISTIRTGSSAAQSTTARLAMASATALDIGSNDFTLETFVRFDRLPTGSEYYTIFNRWNENSVTGRSYRLYYGGPSLNGNKIDFQTSTDGSGATAVTKISYPWSPQANRWYHLALCRSGGDLLLFVDGKQLGLPIPDSDTYKTVPTAAFAIGTYYPQTSTTQAGTAGSQLIGRLDETRFTNGVGRYTSTFTPPTSMFPRGVSDPDWASVVLLIGYDSGINDESSFARAIDVRNGAGSFLPADGASIGAWSTVGTTKSTPDDNTFIQASLTNAVNIYTLTTNPANLDTVTVGTTDGVTPAVYTYKTVLASAFDVLIGATAQDTLNNLLNAINAGAGSGTTYGSGTTSNNDVSAVPLPSGQIQVIALIAGTTGNSIAVADSSPGIWDNPTNLHDGANIPGPSAFKVQRPPTNTTVISALQMNFRALKTDSGTATVQATFVGPLGGTEAGAAHALTVSGIGYNDIIEIDPDTSGPLSPTTLINGKFSINRTA